MSTTEALLKAELDLAWQNIFKRDTHAAMEHAKKASTISSDSPDVAHVLGVIASRDGRSDLALPLLQKALNGGVTERRLRDMAEALVLAKHPEAALAPINDAIKQFGESSETLGLLAAIYVALERFDEASQTAQRAIALKPNSLAWETTVAFCDLIAGRYSSGLKSFTFRPQTMSEGGRCPVLNFSEPGDLWLKNEQGPGDTLFFLCHASALAKNGWRLHVQSHLRTQKLLEDTGLFASVSLGFECPKEGFWINIGDLPLAATQLGHAPLSEPMPLKPQGKLVDKLRKLLEKFGPPPYIAVTWRGGVQGSKVRNGVRMGDRYVDTRQFGEMLKDIDARIISVQRIPDNKEAAAFEAGMGKKLLDLSRLNNNLPEMLALMELVDDYIAVPNTNHHLREALGKPTKIIVNRPYEDWRWVHEGNSPWYPNAKCYRQSLDGSLDAVFDAIRIDLMAQFGGVSDKASKTEAKLQLPNSHEQVSDSSQILELLQAGWKAVGANDVPTGIKYAQQVMAISPDNASAFHLLGWAAMRDLKLDLAVSVLSRASELDPSDGRIIGDYVRALSASQQHSKAIEVATEALNNPATNNRSSIHYGRAACYLSSNKPKEAIEDYLSCISINPNRLDAQEYCGMAMLKMGDAINGFRQYSARKVAQRDELLNDWCCPVLNAGHKGSRVLIKRDMGLGDELTYLRYLPWLTSAGMKVDYWAGKKLVPVLERMGYLSHVYPDNLKPPASSEYDLSFIVNDLPVAAHGLGAPAIAPPLPLNPRSDLVEKWKAWLKSLGKGPYIGLNWKAGLGVQGAGNIFSKLAKAVDAEPFAKALSTTDATWISLQRNVLSEEVAQFQQHLNAPLHDAVTLTDDIEDLLALLSLLDENIGVSNTNMHLRASLGLGSRVMVQTPGGDWRWGIDGTQSPWFTESKVYRQHIDGTWNESLEKLSADLRNLYGTVTHTEAPKDSKASYLKHADLSKRLIWVTAGAIKTENGVPTSALASARYRVIAPSQALNKAGWTSEIVNEETSQVMGGWGSATPKEGDVVIISKVFGEHALKLAKDAKSKGAQLVVDFCDNFLDHPKRGPLQHALLKTADKVVAASEAMAYAIKKHGYQVDAVISDPVEMSYSEPQFSPKKTLELLWFGHAVNIDTLKEFLPTLAQYSLSRSLHLNVVTTLPNGKSDLDKLMVGDLSISYTPWSVEATQKAIEACDIVIIPVLASQFKMAKSPNRLLEPLQRGRMVVAGPLPAYLPFGDSAWVGEKLTEGIEWCLKHPAEVLARIKQGQTDIATHFTQQAIATQWNDVFKQEKTLVSKPKEVDFELQHTSPLEPYFQAKEAARILGLSNQTEAQIKLNYFSHYPKKQNINGSKVAVYTAIFGGYDTAPILHHVDSNIDYILYTDQADFDAPSPWQVRVVPAIFKDPQVDARRIKVLSHLFLADYDIAVWIDGNFTLEKLSVELVQDIASRAPVALCKHQFRNCIYDESIEILKRGIDASTPVLKQMQYYQARQFPAQFGLHATGFLVRNHKDSQSIKMNMRWWELLSTNSKRDQLSFDYVRWEAKVAVMSLPFNQRDNRLFEWGVNGVRKHKIDVRRNDEHDGRALNYSTLTAPVESDQQYHPLFDCWHTQFLTDLFALNQKLIDNNHRLDSSVLYSKQIYDGAILSAQCLPDPRLGESQRLLLSKVCQSKRILQIGFDGGHVALMAIHYSGAKIVVVDEHLNEYKQAGMAYLSNQHAKRFANFTKQEVSQLGVGSFNLICVACETKSAAVTVFEEYSNVLTSDCIRLILINGQTLINR